MDKQIFTSFDLDELKQIIQDCISDSLSKEFQTINKEQKEEELLTINSIQKLFSVSKVTIHKWKKQGLIPFYKLNRKLYFKKSEVLDSMKHKKRKLEL